jgi:hypothetical protein
MKTPKQKNKEIRNSYHGIKKEKQEKPKCLIFNEIHVDFFFLLHRDQIQIQSNRKNYLMNEI